MYTFINVKYIYVNMLTTLEFAQSALVLSDCVLELTTGLLQMPLELLILLLELAYGVFTTLTTTGSFFPFIQ